MKAACRHCGLALFENEADGVWYHEATADRECWGHPFYGTRTAAPLVQPPDCADLFGFDD